jgi:hypothetical protein
MDFADIAYALGVGAMGSSVDDALPLMGEHGRAARIDRMAANGRA